MISWLTINTNPPALDTEIIVKNSEQMKWCDKCTYTQVKLYRSDVHSEESMLDDLAYCKFDLWSDVT